MTSWLQITDQSTIGEARRITRAAARDCGFDAASIEKVAIVATEAATNLHRHARNGRFVCTRQPGGDLVILAMDDGPGMENPERMMVDGVSTIGTMGTGLGAMKRLSDHFEIWSRPDEGTILIAGFAGCGGKRPPDAFELAGLRVAAPGYTECGDNFGWQREAGDLKLFLCDGFGHGPVAAEDADLILERFCASGEADVGLLLASLCETEGLHRGAVGMLVGISDDGGDVISAGVGNIAGLILGRDGARRMVSRDGSIGGRCLARPMNYEFPKGSVLVLHSDGIRTFRYHERHQGLIYRSCLMIAATILKDGFRGNDDASVMVLRRRDGADD